MSPFLMRKTISMAQSFEIKIEQGDSDHSVQIVHKEIGNVVPF